MSLFDDPVEDDPAPETPLDETTPPMDLIEKADDESESTTPEDPGESMVGRHDPNESG